MTTQESLDYLLAAAREAVSFDDSAYDLALPEIVELRRCVEYIDSLRQNGA